MCHSPLVGEATAETFPSVPTIYGQYRFFFKIFSFISVALSVLALSVNWILEETGLWAHFVVLGFVCVWSSLSVAIRKRKNIPKGMLYQVSLISIFAVVWDFLTGWRGWSIDFAVPILSVSAMVVMAILSRIFNWQIQNLIVYFCIDALFGIIPLVLLCLRLVHNRIPSILCVAGSLISVAAIAAFHGDSIWAELKRRLYL